MNTVLAILHDDRLSDDDKRTMLTDIVGLAYHVDISIGSAIKRSLSAGRHTVADSMGEDGPKATFELRLNSPP